MSGFFSAVSHWSSSIILSVLKLFQERQRSVGNSATRLEAIAYHDSENTQLVENSMLRFRALLSSPAVQSDMPAQSINQAKALIADFAPLSPVTSRILTELRSGEANCARIASLVQQDPVLTMTMLRLANSASTAQNREVTSVEQAIMLLGNDVLLSVAVSGTMSGLLSASSERVFDHDALLRHAVATGIFAGAIAQKHRRIDVGDAVTAALLHDVGKIVMESTSPRSVRELLDPANMDFTHSRLAREEKLFGANHAVLGAMLAGHWQLPPALIAAIEFHHHRDIPTQAALTPRERDLAAVVFVSNQLAKYAGCTGDDIEVDLPTAELLSMLNLGETYESILRDILPLVSVKLNAFRQETPEPASQRKSRRAPVRHENDFQGSLSTLPLLHVIQMLGETRRTGTLKLAGEDTAGAIQFIEGKLAAAVCGDLLGEEAFHKLSMLNDGQFVFTPKAADFPESSRISLPLMQLLMESLRRKDEALHKTK